MYKANFIRDYWSEIRTRPRCEVCLNVLEGMRVKEKIEKSFKNWIGFPFVDWNVDKYDGSWVEVEDFVWRCLFIIIKWMSEIHCFNICDFLSRLSYWW